MTEDQISRFWAKVDRSGGNTACWPWMGGRNDDGYGIYHNSQTNRQMGAHRMAYMLSKGAIENGLLVLHSCDNPSCVNPAHLHLGTQKENLQESVAKGRKAQKGIRTIQRYSMKIDVPAELLEKLTTYHHKRLTPELARRAKLSAGTIYLIIRGEQPKVGYRTYTALQAAIASFEADA